MLRKLAIISQSFKDLVKTFTQEIIYKTPAFKKKKKYLSVLRGGSEDSGWFYFVERLGKDSVAFLLYDPSSHKPFGLLKFWSTPYSSFLTDAFTGSLDKPNLTKEKILLEEVEEEAGYKVQEANCTLVGEYKIGTSTNETCFGYLVDVNRRPQMRKKPENLFEENSDIIWMSGNELLKDSEVGWRGKMILQDAIRKGKIPEHML